MTTTPPTPTTRSRRRPRRPCHVDAEGHGRGAEDLTAEEKQTNLMMDMDWDTTQWSLREIEAACSALVQEIKDCPLDGPGQKRRDYSQQMLLRLCNRHVEALYYFERVLESMVNHSLPGLSYGLDQHALNLAPLLAAMAPIHDYAQRLLDIKTIRRVIDILLVEPNLAANIIQCAVHMRFFCDPNHRHYALPDDAPEAEVLLHEKENRERCRRKYFAKCMEHEALVNKWKRAKAERLADLDGWRRASIARMDKEPGGLKRKKKSALKGGMDYHHVTKTALVDRAVRSKLVGVAERTRHEVCGKKGEGITGLVCIARLHGDDEKRCKALRILLLVASAASLSVLTCCRQPATAPASPVLEKPARTAGDGSGTPPRPGTGASGASDRAPSTPGGSEVDRPPSTAGSGGRRKARGDRGDEAFHEPCGEVDAVRELARPGWLAVVLELLNGRDEALFLGAVRFCQRCAASCEGAMRHVLKEVLAFGGRPLERAIVGGLASGPNRGGRGALAGCACLELLAQLRAAQESEIPNFKGSDLGHFPLAQLTTFPPGRMGLVAARVEDMLAPLLASGDPTQPAFLRSLIVLLYASRVGRSPVVLPGALGDECVADQDSRSYRRLQKGRRRDKPSTPADAHKRDAATLTDHCRGAFEALCGASDDDVAASGLVLAKLKAAMPIFQFLCQPKKQSFLYELERRARYAHCVVLRRLFGAAPPLPRMLFDCGADALLRFCSFAVQAGFNEIEDGDVKHLSASDRRLHYFAVESMLLTLSCAANVKDEGFVDCGLDADRAEKRRLNALRDDRAGRGLRRRGGISSALTGSDARELRDDARDDDDERDDGAQLISVASTTSQTTSASLLEAPVAPRNLVAQMLLSTSTLGDVLGLARRVPTSEIVAIDALAAAEAKVVSAAAAFVAAAAPVPFPDKLHDLKYEPAVGEDAGYAAAEVTLRPLRAQAVDPLRASLSVDAPLECRAAACGALAKLGATPAGADELHARGVIRGVIRALSRLAPRRPVTQAAVDKVIRSVPRSAIIDGDHSATLHLDLETCRLVRLPVAW
ncbi:hypothetical protein JL721_11816 [Aureococcus anophagefferens]|nr:hypothetical protein JL721_11816 [Aureococcus anophagefferens]